MVLKTFLTQHPTGLYAVCGAESPAAGDRVTAEDVSRLLAALAREFRYVVVDTAPGLSAQTLAALDRATDVVMLSSMDVPGVRGLRKELDVLRELCMIPAGRHVVMNFADPKTGSPSATSRRRSARAWTSSCPGRRRCRSRPTRACRCCRAAAANPMARSCGASSPASPPRRSSAPAGTGPSTGRRRWTSPPAWPPPAGPPRRRRAEASQPPAVPAPRAAAVPRSRPPPTDALGRLKDRVAKALFERMGSRLNDPSLGEDQLRTLVLGELDEVVEEEKIPLSADERARLTAELADDVLGLGPLQRLLDDDTISEIMVNGPDTIYVEQRGKLVRTGARFTSEEHLRRVIDRIVSRVGRRIDESSPLVDARLADGSRVNAIIPPLAFSGSTLTIRKFAKDPFSVEDLIGFGTLSPEMAELLRRLRRGPAQRHRLRRYRHRQDDAAQRAVLLHPGGRADRHHRGRRRAPAPAGPRRPAGVPAAQHRGQGRGHHPRPGPQLAAHAARPDRRRGVPRRRERSTCSRR